MIDRYITINRLLRGITKRCHDAVAAGDYETSGMAEALVTEYIQRDVRDLLHAWPPDLNSAYVKRIGQRVAQKDKGAFSEVLAELVPELEDQIDRYFAQMPVADLSSAILGVLHPVVTASAYAQFRAGHLRDAVFNAFVAVFDLLREKSGLDKDGAALVAEALSLEKPKLILSTLGTESGQNDQKGFIQILQGAYLGVRSPKAHSLASDLDDSEAAQYLVFASLLARRVEEARPPS
jgi:uncharacterized protein (TIGR02391 family)